MSENIITPCGPKICYTCPSPNDRTLWTPPKPNVIIAKEQVDPVRRNIYNGGIICGFEPRDKINDMMCARNFIHAPARPAYEWNHVTDIGFYLRHGESSSCSSHWQYRFEKTANPSKYERVGPASLENQ